MTVSSSCIGAQEAEEMLGARGLTRESEGFNNDFFAVWRNRETGAVCSVAYCRFGDRTSYSRAAFEKVLEELDAG